MIITHLTAFRFLDGASHVTADPKTFGGYHPLGLFAQVRGWTDAGTPPVPPPVPVVPSGPVGTSGIPPAHYGRKLKKPIPDGSLDYLIDKEAWEFYQEILRSRADEGTKQEVRALVKPFSKRARPTIASVDWQALEAQVDTIGRLMRIWQKEVLDREIDDEDEWLLLNS